MTLRDPVAAGTHLAAFVWALYGSLLLWRLSRGDILKRCSTACFGLSMIVLYAASTTYHSLILPPAELQLYRLLDHSAIYGLIAGSYTPVFAVLLKGRTRRNLLVLIWSLAFIGIALKWLLPVPHYMVTVSAYVAMGWVGLMPVVKLSRVVGARAVALGIFGGVLYTAGAFCDLIKWPVIAPGFFASHELMHVLGVGGTFCHFIFIIEYVVPFQRRVATIPMPAAQDDDLALAA